MQKFINWFTIDYMANYPIQFGILLITLSIFIGIAVGLFVYYIGVLIASIMSLKIFLAFFFGSVMTIFAHSIYAYLYRDLEDG
jgi:uncharacterized membrane protein (DUF441 family)